jgi:hypothetical protein
MNNKKSVRFSKLRGGAAGMPGAIDMGNTPSAPANAPPVPSVPANASAPANSPPAPANSPPAPANSPPAPANSPPAPANSPSASSAPSNASKGVGNTPGGNTGSKAGNKAGNNSPKTNNKIGPKNNNKGGILDNIKNMTSNAINTAGNTLNNIKNKGGNLLNKSKNLGGNILNTGDNLADNVKGGKYNKWGFIFVVAISLILIIHFVSYIVSNYYKKMNRSPLLVPHTKNAKHTVIISQDPESINYIPIKRSDNEEGIEFAYSFWSLIQDYDYKNGEWKHMFHKGNSTSYPNRAPGVWLHPNENKMRVYMNTFDNILEYVDIDDIPVKKWFCTTVVLQNAESRTQKDKDVNVSDGPSHIMDVYINGNLKKSKLLTSIPRQNNGDLWINLFGGFSGYLSRLQYHSYAPDYKEIEAYLKNGPSAMTAQDTGEMPPYLDDKWWFK